MSDKTFKVSELQAVQSLDDDDLLLVSDFTDGKNPRTRNLNISTLANKIRDGLETTAAVDEKLQAKADISAVTEVDEKLQAKADISAVTDLTEIVNEKSTVSVDNIKTDINIVKLSFDQYEELIVNNAVLSNNIYMLSGDNFNLFNEKIVNLAPGTNPSDAVNMSQLSALKEYIDQKIAELRN